MINYLVKIITVLAIMASNASASASIILYADEPFMPEFMIK